MTNNLKLPFFVALLFLPFFLSAQEEINAFLFSGTYETTYLDVKLKTPGPDAKADHIEASAEEFVEKVGVKRKVTEYISDGKFKITYYGQNDLPSYITSGEWKISGDTMFLKHTKPVQDEFEFIIKLNEKEVHYEGFVDWDYDEVKDDFIKFTDRKIDDEMMTYYMIFLHRGEKANDIPKEKLAEIQAAHLANINKLAEEGKLVLAGPFMDDSDLRGIFILKAESLEEAQEFTNTDPAVKAGRLRMEVKPWYGPSKLKYLFD